MDGNVCFHTPKGLKFYNCNRDEVQNLINCAARLKAQRDGKSRYRFVVTIEEIGRIEADDIWISVGVCEGA